MKLSNSQKYNIRFPSSTENLTVVRDFVTNLAKKAGCPEGCCDNIALAVDEACTNVIKHAHHHDPEIMIDLSVRFKDNKFQIIITDQGAGFKPDTMPKPDISKYVHEAKKGGLGLQLMKSLMDEIHYNLNPGKTNQLTMVKYIDPNEKQ